MDNVLSMFGWKTSKKRPRPDDDSSNEKQSTTATIKKERYDDTRSTQHAPTESVTDIVDVTMNDKLLFDLREIGRAHV